MILLLGLPMFAQLIPLEALLTIGSLLLSLPSSPSLSNCSLHAVPPTSPPQSLIEFCFFFPTLRDRFLDNYMGHSSTTSVPRGSSPGTRQQHVSSPPPAVFLTRLTLLHIQPARITPPILSYAKRHRSSHLIFNMCRVFDSVSYISFTGTDVWRVL